MEQLIKRNIIRYSEIKLPHIRFISGVDRNIAELFRRESTELNQHDNLTFNNSVWMNSLLYLYAVDLFNFQYWWETHEVLEKLWIKTCDESKLHNFLQGIILISAALLKHRESSALPALKLYKKSIDKMNIHSEIYLGIHIKSFKKSVKEYLTGQCIIPPIIKLTELIKL